jgi:hypothetical protein
LPEETVEQLFKECAANEGYQLTIDLAAQEVISAKLGAITVRNPYSFNAQGACSRLEPQPKLVRAIKLSALVLATTYLMNFVI